METTLPKATRKSKVATSDSTVIGFEASLGELEKLVERLEGGEQSLENALKDFERGIVLTRQCQQALKNAELHVQQLLQRNDQESLEDFETGDEPPVDDA
ncbi:MAG TPA: exodeoxyribonuclease VII small subunit [Gammaproteobacteria bacterium]